MGDRCSGTCITLTVTPIYWAPPTGAAPFPPGYGALVNGYIANVAAASGASTNVYSIDTEYYDLSGGQFSFIRNRIAAGPPIVDTQPLPRSGCRPEARGFSACITDDQLQTELRRVLGAHHLSRGLTNFYPVFFPPGVETAAGTETSVSTYCAYHSIIGAGASAILYGNEPYVPGCNIGQSPNANPAADGAIDARNASRACWPGIPGSALRRRTR